jgi:ATP-dependent RNA helicase DeaD
MSDTDESALVTFDALPLTNDVRRAVDELGYVHPTPVQRAVFEPATRGRDLVVQARTGTGKTAAFGLALVDGIVKPTKAVVQAMVLCPTRELALQIAREVGLIAKHRGTKLAAVYGGAPMSKQIDQLREGAQILIGTPGRVLDHLRRGTLDVSAVRTLVLDESDEMLSMGFLPQISEIWSYLPESRQVLLFSATLPPDVKRIAETRLKKPEYLTLSGDSIGALSIQHFVYMSLGDKLTDLVSMIEVENPESAIVFCNTRDDTKRVAAALQAQGFAADWLNADLSQAEREQVMAATRRGDLRFLVATDVAARGIDISHLTHVINFDFPDSAESYVHRTGRTGRAGRTGTAISLISPANIGGLYLLRLTYKIRPIERQLPSARERKTRAEADLVQMFVELARGRPVHGEDLALARRLLTHESAERVVATLLRDHLGARPEAAEEATAARRAKSTPVAEERDPSEARHQREEPARDDRPRQRDREEPVRDDRPRQRDREEPARDDRPRQRDDERRRQERTRQREPERAAAPPPREPAPKPRDEPQSSERQADSHQTLESARIEMPPPVRGETAPPEVVEPAPLRASDSSPALEPIREIFVNVGRRDGAKPSDFQRLLEQGGIPAGDSDYIRVRHSHAFVGVRSDWVERAVAALNGAQIAGQRVVAEPARRR